MILSTTKSVFVHTHNCFKQLLTIIMIMLFGLSGYDGFAQADPSLPTFTPDGLFDKVFDQNGNQYNIADLIITNQNRSPNNILLRTVPINCNSNSIFSLFFEDGSGMEPVADPIQNGINAGRRAVACQVFQDLSDFLTNASSPLQPTSNVKVNIWVRNITNMNNVDAGTLGLASSFFNMPSNATLGGIADNEIWKTIHNGVDSYTNVTAPIATTTGSSNGSGIFYHGMMAFDFTNFTWNTNTSQQATAAQFDLYTVILHEVTHALGFASIIDKDGLSKFGNNFRYFSRYDTFLRTNNLSAPLLTTTNANPMYNNVFNPSLNTTILHPGALPCVTDTTNCLSAIQYVGTTTVPVYTPNCFSNGSSLSHFEDQLFPTCANPHGNNQYFVMSDSNGMGVTKRFLKPEERIALCDMGYAVNATYGVSGAVINSGNTSFNYPSTTVCSGITVAGICDGRTATNNYQYIGNAGAPITILGSQILGNDSNAAGFTALEDMRDPAAVAITNGTNATTITFNSTMAGVHLLRYIPTNGTQQGNITYIYVFVNSTTFTVNGPICAPTPNACDLVMNGNFEQNITNINNLVNRACGWWTNSPATADLHTSACNFFGIQNDAIAGNNNYGGFWTSGWATNNSTSLETVNTRLKQPLIAGFTYQLTYNISLAEASRGVAVNTSAFLSNSDATQDINGNINTNNGILLTNGLLTSSSDNNIWDTVSFTFTSVTGGEEFLVIGAISDVTFGPNPLITSPSGACSFYTSPVTQTQLFSYNYIDNVSLIPTNGATFNFPATICGGTTIPDLAILVDAVPVGGVFTGQGVLLDAITGIYSYDPSTLAAGTYAITYSYNNSAGCPIALVRNVTVTPLATPAFDQINPICAGNTFVLETTDLNGITGTWSPAEDFTATTTYTFTPTAGLCASTSTMTVEVIAPAVISGEPIVCENNIIIFTASEPGGTWSVSDPSLADMDPNTGKFKGLLAGLVKVFYEINGSQCPSDPFEVTVIDSTTRPDFSFPTTICLGSTPPLLPPTSDNGMTGFWTPATIDNMTTGTYNFKTTAPLCDKTFTFAVTVIDPNTDPVVANPDVISQHFALVASTTTDSILNNDTFAGVVITPSVSGLIINLFDAPPGVTANIDGTLNIPSDLPVGQYIIKYQVKTECGQAYAVVTLNITNDAGIVAPPRHFIDPEYCLNSNPFTTNNTVLNHVTINGIPATTANVDISNFVTPNPAIILNPNGTLSFPANTPYIDYYFTCTVCPSGSTVGCVNLVRPIQWIAKTLYINFDGFECTTDGILSTTYGLDYLMGNPMLGITDNDQYDNNCQFVYSPNTKRALLGTNVTVTNVNMIGDTGAFFQLNQNTGILTAVPGAQIPPGTYYFGYTLCDINHPNVCETVTTNWIRVNAQRKAGTNSSLEKPEVNFDKITIYPNPSTNIFNIDFKGFVAKTTKVEVYNILSQKMFEDEVSNVSVYKLSLENLPTGNYLVKIKDGNQTISKKIIKQ